jgi:hypothetical protein
MEDLVDMAQLMRDRIRDYEAQLEELRGQPKTIGIEHQMLSLQAQLTMDKDALRKYTGEFLRQ